MAVELSLGQSYKDRKADLQNQCKGRIRNWGRFVNRFPIHAPVLHLTHFQLLLLYFAPPLQLGNETYHPRYLGGVRPFKRR